MGRLVFGECHVSNVRSPGCLQSEFFYLFILHPFTKFICLRKVCQLFLTPSDVMLLYIRTNACACPLEDSLFFTE